MNDLLLSLFADAFKTPAPGTYLNEKVFPQGEKHAPAYSMGSRTRYRKRMSVLCRGTPEAFLP